MSTYKFSCGDSVRDVVTGYTGVVTGFAYYYGNRPSCYLVENVDGTGRPIEQWVDETRLDYCEKQA